MTSVVRLLQRLISIPSVNPALPGHPEFLGEHRMTEFLAGLFREKGFLTERMETVPGRPSLVARLGVPNPQKTLMLEGHLDTVSVEGMTVSPFAGEERDGRIWGRGACDMKGAMAAAMDAMEEEVLDAFRASGRELMFVGAIDEEVGARGARQLALRGVGADEAIILEPTRCDLVVAHKGPARFYITLRGRAGHGSNPSCGVNAIDAAALLIPRLHAAFVDAWPKSSHPLLGVPTINIGRIQGGTAVNVVPGECRIEVDLRLLPGDTLKPMRARLQCELETGLAKGMITGYLLEDSEVPAFLAEENSSLVQRFRKVIQQGGFYPKVVGTPWYSDAGAFADTCKEVVVFGPGDIAQAHTSDEYIEIEELIRGRTVLRNLMLRFAKE